MWNWRSKWLNSLSSPGQGMPGFSGTHGNTRKQKKEKKNTATCEKIIFYPRKASLTVFMSECLHIFHFLSTLQLLQLPVPTSHPSNSWWNSLMLFLWWCQFICVCAAYSQGGKDIVSKKPTQIICVRMFVYERGRDARARLGAVWVRGEAWDTADKLVNEQTWRPPCGTVTSPPPPPLLRSSSAVTLASTVLLTPHLWLD